MEEKQIMSPGIKGLLISLVLIVLSVIVIITNQYQNQVWNIISIAVFVGGVVWACVSYSKQMDANVTFGNVFSHGFKASAAIAVLQALWLFLAISFFFPSMLDAIGDAQRVAMEKKGMSDDDIEKSMEMAAKFTKPMMIAGSAFMSLLIGAIASLIGAAIAKKNPNTSMPQ
jgi:hypothetical protein